MPLRKHPAASPQMALSQPGSCTDLGLRLSWPLWPPGFPTVESRDLSLLKSLWSKRVCPGARRARRCPLDSHPRKGGAKAAYAFGESHCSLSRNRTVSHHCHVAVREPRLPGVMLSAHSWGLQHGRATHHFQPSPLNADPSCSHNPVLFWYYQLPSDYYLSKKGLDAYS